MATLTMMLSIIFIQFLLLVGSSQGSSAWKEIQNREVNSNHNLVEPAANRKLNTYALYNLDNFSVRVLTGKTEELQQAHALALETKTVSDMGRQWILVSETGGVSSSLSYPLRTVTQDFLYLGFQNLMDDWLLELSGGPDGNNDLSYRDTGNRRLQIREEQVYNLDGGDSTGEQDYNTIGTTPTIDSAAAGTEIEIETETMPTPHETAEPQTSRATNDILPSETTAPQVPPADSTSSKYVNIYEGLVYHSMYEHLVTVDLRVKLYLRKNGISGDMDLDSVRRNLRNLQDTGEVELLAEVSPTIAFLEPVSEAKRLNKPSNEDVKNVFGGWMEYIFSKQRGLYMSTLLQYEDQALLQEISTLRVDVATSPSVSAANSSNYGPGGAWSKRTQKVLMSFLIILGTVALIWPMYAYRQYVKRREITLQIMNSEGADEYDFSGSFSSVTYKDAIEDALQLPPISPNVPPPNSFSPFPQALSKRGNSLDAIRHGSDVFPSKDRDLSQKSAMSALEASDRYLSRHRPDLFYDQHSLSSSGKVSVFGRSYEIPSNPFEFIYKGRDEPPQQQHQDLSTPTGSSDLGRNAHFPFASPRSSFSAPRSSSVGSNGYMGRSTSVGSIGSAGKPTRFTPIAEPNQNLAAGFGDDDEVDQLFTSPGVAAHTGQSWQNGEMSSLQQPVPQLSPQGGVIGTIFRNLSISSWYNGNNIENSYTANSNTDPEFYSNPATEEIYYDDYHHQHQDPSLFQREIELESLPNDEEESPANYDFAFQDFPRKDGTPCLIIDDDSFLSERKRRESAKMIFNFDDEANTSMEDDGSLTEKKIDSNTPVSDESFKQLLAQNISEIDSSFIKLASSEELPPLESFLNKDPHDAKSPEFQSKLSRLMETKQQRYTRENRNAAIVAANRKKRKNVRERERVDRHKAIERELEDIEAEFSLTMQPQSPKRNTTSAGAGHHTPKRKLSPKPPTGGSCYSPMPLRIPASPGRKNIATLSPARNSIAANSPSRSSMSRNRGIARTNSNSSRHRRKNSRGQSPFRTYNPRARHSRSDSLGTNTDTFRSASLPMADFEGQTSDYRPKMRPSSTFDPISGVGDTASFEDLSLPSMPFKSPQAVIDEALQSGASMQNPPRHYRKRSLTPTRTKGLHRRSLTPSRLPANPRRTNSLDMNDDQRRMMRKTSSAKPNSNSNHRRARSGSLGPSHRRTSSRDEDMFLHGVVAQTRFV